LFNKSKKNNEQDYIEINNESNDREVIYARIEFDKKRKKV